MDQGHGEGNLGWKGHQTQSGKLGDHTYSVQGQNDGCPTRAFQNIIVLKHHAVRSALGKSVEGQQIEGLADACDIGDRL